MRRISRGSPAPWWGLRLLLNDQVPATGGERIRDVRADLIDSIVMVMVCLLARVDLKSLRVGHHAGRRRKHDFVGLSVETIATWCGLSVSTVSHVLTLLRRAGLIHGPAREENAANRIGQPWDLHRRIGGVCSCGDAACRVPDGITEWHPAIRRVDVAFFAVLGLGPELHRLRTKLEQPEPEQEAIARGRAVRAAVELEGEHAARLRRLYPDGPPDG
jgi:hypothetical protein